MHRALKAIGVGLLISMAIVKGGCGHSVHFADVQLLTLDEYDVLEPTRHTDSLQQRAIDSINSAISPPTEEERDTRIHISPDGISLLAFSRQSETAWLWPDRRNPDEHYKLVGVHKVAFASETFLWVVSNDHKNKLVAVSSPSGVDGAHVLLPDNIYKRVFVTDPDCRVICLTDAGQVLVGNYLEQANAGTHEHMVSLELLSQDNVTDIVWVPGAASVIAEVTGAGVSWISVHTSHVVQGPLAMRVLWSSPPGAVSYLYDDAGSVFAVGVGGATGAEEPDVTRVLTPRALSQKSLVRVNQMSRQEGYVHIPDLGRRDGVPRRIVTAGGRP